MGYAYRDAFNANIITPVTDPVATSTPETGPVATANPKTGPKAEPGKQTVPVSVAPVTKMKKWFRESDHLEHRKTPAKTRYGEDEAGPSEEREDEDEDVAKTTVTTRNLYQREL